MKLDAKSTIEAGKAILGIELGSTRIKAVLIDQENKPIAQGSHTWENQLVDGLWTYSVEAVWYGLQDCYADLRTNVKSLYDTEIETLAAIGVSAMMHGYMAFNEKEEILVPLLPESLHTPALNQLHRKILSYPIPGHSVFPPVRGKFPHIHLQMPFLLLKKYFLETLLFARSSLPALSEKDQKKK